MGITRYFQNKSKEIRITVSTHEQWNRKTKTSQTISSSKYI